MYSNEVKGAPQKPDLLLRSYMVGRVLLRPSSPTIQHIYTYQIKKTVQPTGYDALQGYIKLFEALGEEALYIGGIPLYKLGTDENDLLAPDPLSGTFPRDEGYFVIDISPRWAVLWGTSMGLFSTFLEQGLCTKITWYQEWEEGMCHILMNDDTEDTPNSWQFCEFVIGDDGVPSKYDDENEDAEEKYNRFVADIMKGKVDVEWKDGFPSCERKEFSRWF